MGNNQDMKLQLVIEAINRFQSTFDAFKRESGHIVTEINNMNAAGASAAVTLYDAYGKPIQALHETRAAAAATGPAVAGSGQTAAKGWASMLTRMKEVIVQTESFKLKAGELDAFLAQGIGVGTFFLLIREAWQALNTVEKTGNSLRGLAAISRYSGESIGQSISAGMELAEDGLINVQETSQALQNLLSRGFSLQEAINMINRLKDAAAFNRQAHLSMGQAVTSATEGIKNENSILVDNAGVTKNVSVMWKEYALQHGKSVESLTQAEKRQAEYNGIMRETEGQVGNAMLAIEGITGAKAKLSQEVFKLRNALGEGETGLFYTLANGAGWALEKVRSFIGGIEILAVKSASFWDKLAIRKDIALSGKGLFSQEGVKEYETRVKSIIEAEDAQIATIIAKWEGKVTAPNIGQDSGKRRQDLALPDNKAAEKIAKYREEVRKILSDLDTAFEKASWEDKSTQRVDELINKYADLMAKFPKERVALQKRMDRDIQQAEEEGWSDWAKEIEEQSKKAAIAAERSRDALRKVDEDISANSSSELDKRLAEQDKFYKESLEKLQDAGVDFETIIAKETELFAVAEQRKLQIRNEFLNQQRQAEINHKLSEVDYGEKSGEMNTVDAIRQRISLVQQELELQENSLSKLSENSSAWLAQQAAIDGTRQKLLELKLQARDLSDNLAAGVIAGLEQYLASVRGNYRK